MEKIFWIDGDYEAQGGYYVRNTLKEFIEKLEARNIEVAGIKYDGTYNLEILIKKQ